MLAYPSSIWTWHRLQCSRLRVRVQGLSFGAWLSPRISLCEVVCGETLDSLVTSASSRNRPAPSSFLISPWHRVQHGLSCKMIAHTGTAVLGQDPVVTWSPRQSGLSLPLHPTLKVLLSKWKAQAQILIRTISEDFWPAWETLITSCVDPQIIFTRLQY